MHPSTSHHASRHESCFLQPMSHMAPSPPCPRTRIPACCPPHPVPPHTHSRTLTPPPCPPAHSFPRHAVLRFLLCRPHTPTRTAAPKAPAVSLRTGISSTARTTWGASWWVAGGVGVMVGGWRGGCHGGHEGGWVAGWLAVCQGRRKDGQLGAEVCV